MKRRDVGDADDQAIVSEKPGHRLSPRLGACRVQQLKVCAHKLAARRSSGRSAASATSPLPNGCRETRDQSKGDDSEYAGEDLSDKSLEAIAVEEITAKEESAEQRGQRQGSPDEQPAACGAGPALAGSVE